MRTALIAIVTLGALLIGSYAALPWLVNTLLVPRIVDRAGLDALSLEMGYPGLGSLHVSRLHLVAAPVQLSARNLVIAYDLQGLREGRLENLVAGEVQIVVVQADDAMPADDPAITDPGAQPAPNEPVELESLLAQIPADRLQVEQLELRLPARDFIARGTLDLDAAGLEAHLIGLEPDIARDLSATLRMSRTGTLELSVSDPDPLAPSSLLLEAEPATAELALEGSFSITGYILELLQEAAGLPAGSGEISGALTTRLPWPLAGLPEWQTLAADGQLAADWSLSQPDLALNDLSAEFALRDGIVTLIATGSTRFSTDELDLSATLTGGAFTYRDGWISSEDAGLEVTAKSASLIGEAEVRSFRTTVAAPFDSTFSGSLALAEDATFLKGLISATVTGAPENYAGTFEFDGTADGGRLIDLPALKLEDYPLQLAGNYSLRGDDLKASASLSARTVEGLPLEIEHDLPSAAGKLTFSHTQTVSKPLLVDLLPGWQAPYDLDSGRLDLSGTLTWHDGLQGSFMLQPRALVAHYDDYTAYNAAGRLDFSLIDSTLTLLPSTLTAEAVDIGVPITNVNLAVAGSLETLTINHATAELLGGSASTDPFDYQVETGSADLIVTLTDIDLAEILALEGEKVSGSGRLSGTIPVSLRNHEVHIEGGAINAGIPGRIQLSSALTAGISQPGLDIALKALENFNYDALNVNVDYDEAGNMLLGVRLEGRNPDLEGGRPVHFNLNISENIPVLLQSLRLQDNFTKSIERRVLQ